MRFVLFLVAFQCCFDKVNASKPIKQNRLSFWKASFYLYKPKSLFGIVNRNGIF